MSKTDFSRGPRQGKLPFMSWLSFVTRFMRMSSLATSTPWWSRAGIGWKENLDLGTPGRLLTAKQMPNLMVWHSNKKIRQEWQCAWIIKSCVKIHNVEAESQERIEFWTYSGCRMYCRCQMQTVIPHHSLRILNPYDLQYPSMFDFVLNQNGWRMMNAPSSWRCWSVK